MSLFIYQFIAANADTENAKFESIIACEDVKQCMVSSL